MATETVTFGKLTAVVRTRTYEDKLARMALQRKLVEDAPEGETPEERDLRTAKINFCWLATQSELEGADFVLPGKSASKEEIEAAFLKFIKLPETFIENWQIEASRIDVDDNPASLPPELLSIVQSADPKSGRSARRSRKESVAT